MNSFCTPFFHKNLDTVRKKCSLEDGMQNLQHFIHEVKLEVPYQCQIYTHTLILQNK